MPEDCLFCKIIQGEIPSNKVYEDEKILAFRDINPAAKEHVLLIPKKHIYSIGKSLGEDKELLGELLLKAKNLAGELGIEESGYRLVINNGPDGGQTVDHLHLHLIGGRKLDWPPG